MQDTERDNVFYIFKSLFIRCLGNDGDDNISLIFKSRGNFTQSYELSIDS